MSFHKDLTFLLFGRDVTASSSLRHLAGEGERTKMTMGKAFAGIGLAVAGAAVAIGVESVKMAAAFESATTRLVTDAGTKASDLGKVQQGILAVSSATGTSADEAARGMYVISSAGYTGAAGLKVLHAAAEGAKVGYADLNTVSDALTTAMTDYALPAGKATSVTNALIATVSHGKTTMEDLAGSLHNVLPNAESAGLGLNQVLGAMATLTGEGISADQASQNLNHAIIALAAPSAVQRQELGQLGISATDLSHNLGKRGLTGTYELLHGAVTKHMGKDGLVIESAFNTSKLAAQSATAMLKQLPPELQHLGRGFLDGTVTQKQWTAALKNQPALVNNLGRQFGTTAKHAHGFSDLLKSGGGVAQTYIAAIEKATGGQQGLSVMLHLTGTHMGTFKKNVHETGAALGKNGKHVTDWGTYGKTLNAQWSKASATFGDVGIELGTALMPAVKKLLPLVVQFGDWVMHHKKQIKDFAGGISDLAGEFAHGAKQWGDAFHTLKSGIDATVTGFKHGAGQIHDFLTGLVGNFKHGADQITGFFTGLPGAFNTIAHNMVDGLTGGLRDAWGGITSTLHDLAMLLPEPVRNALGIHSPSTVFREIGHWIGAGLEQGLIGSQKGVEAASNRLASTIVGMFQKGSISRWTEVHALAELEVGTRRLEKIAKQRAAVEASLSKARTSLTSHLQAKRDDAAGVKANTVGAGDITQLGAPGDIVQNLAGLVARTRRFRTDLKKLVAKGIDRTTFSELVNAGVDGGGLTTAEGLLANPTDLREIIALQNQLGSAAGSLGSLVAGHDYNAKIRSDRHAVSRLTAHDRHLIAEQKTIAARTLRQTAQTLNINVNGVLVSSKAELGKAVASALREAQRTGAISKGALHV